MPNFLWFSYTAHFNRHSLLFRNLTRLLRYLSCVTGYNSVYFIVTKKSDPLFWFPRSKNMDPRLERKCLKNLDPLRKF